MNSKREMLNTLGIIPTSDSPHSKPVRTAKKKTQNYVREEDLQERFNESLIATLNLPRQNYYNRLNFDQVLRLKGGLARIHDIVTLKLTLALVDTIAQRFFLNNEARAALQRGVNATHPNCAGFDIDMEDPNLIAEVKGCIPMNAGNIFGAAQLKGLTNDVLQMLGQPAHGKTLTQLTKRAKINRLQRTEAIKLLGLYDSDSVRKAAKQWQQNLIRHAMWGALGSATIEDLPPTGDLSPDKVYLVYLKP